MKPHLCQILSSYGRLVRRTHLGYTEVSNRNEAKNANRTTNHSTVPGYVATGCENLSKVLLTSFDVTAQKQTEGLLTEAHKSYKMLIEALTAIVIGIDAF